MRAEGPGGEKWCIFSSLSSSPLRKRREVVAVAGVKSLYEKILPALNSEKNVVPDKQTKQQNSKGILKKWKGTAALVL